MKLLSTIYAFGEDINSLDDFPLLHIYMTQQKLSPKTIYVCTISKIGKWIKQ